VIEKGKAAAAFASRDRAGVYVLEGRARAEIGGERVNAATVDCCFPPIPQARFPVE